MLGSIAVLSCVSGIVGGPFCFAQSENGAPSSTLAILDHPLVCRLKTVQFGQFRGLDYTSAPADGLSVITIAASSDDLRMGRAAVIEEDRAGVAQIESNKQQIILSEIGAGTDVAVLSLFAASRQGDTLPAAFSRHALIGDTPVVFQSQGTCMRSDRK